MPAPLELPPFLRAVADVVRVKAEHKGLHFECDVAPDLPLSVLADDRRLRQVLLNLLGNAVKFTDRGAVTLRVRHGADDAAADLLHFEVADTGPGIAPAHQQDIFKPFEQVGDVRRRAEGTGLGLAISLQLVRLMGGDIHLQSSPGEGSRFWFELRLAPARAEVLQEEARVVTGYEGPRRRLLIIDDVATNRTMLLDLLGRLGFECREAADSAQAIAIAESFRPALVLTDVVMPDVDGIEAARRIRALDGLQRVPVIAMSASVSREDEARVRASGIDAFVAKPIEYALLLEPIGRLLGLRWIEAPAGAVPPVNA
jgi:CheY-like chemotaxis protein/anti-sigma regulatory factor (Ser/Thr protein kinase)